MIRIFKVFSRPAPVSTPPEPGQAGWVGTSPRHGPVTVVPQNQQPGSCLPILPNFAGSAGKKKSKFRLEPPGSCNFSEPSPKADSNLPPDLQKNDP